MRSGQDTATARAEIVAVAAAMLESRKDLIEGVREICALRQHVGDPEDEIFMPIRAIESETDHFPLGAVRENCSAEYLKRVDEEMARYLADARADILAACRQIVRAYSQPPQNSNGNFRNRS